MRMFPSNPGLMLLALLMAASMWAFQQEGRAEAVGFFDGVPVEYQGLPDEYVIAEGGVDSIRVWAVGPPDLVDEIQPEQLAVGIDLSAVETGTTAITLTPSQVPAPGRSHDHPGQARADRDRDRRPDQEVGPRALGDQGRSGARLPPEPGEHPAHAGRGRRRGGGARRSVGVGGADPVRRSRGSRRDLPAASLHRSQRSTDPLVDAGPGRALRGHRGGLDGEELRRPPHSSPGDLSRSAGGDRAPHGPDRRPGGRSPRSTS